VEIERADRSPRQLPSINGKHQDIKAALPSPLKQTKSDFIIMSHIQLEEAGPSGVSPVWPRVSVDAIGIILDRGSDVIRGSDIFDGLRTGRGEAVLRMRNLRRDELSLVAVNL